MTLAPDDASTAESALRAPRATAVVAIVACAALLVASIVAGALVHVVQRGTGASSAAIQERAFFVDADSIGTGVTVLAPIQFVVVPPTSLPITWVASDNHRTYQRGVAKGRPGAKVVVNLPTWTMKPDTWLTISVAGIPTSLRAWIR